MSWLAATRTRLRLLFGRRAAESRMDEEFRFHIDMEAEKLVRERGLDPGEARRRALVAFGGLAMGFAIWVGAVAFEMVMLFVSPTLPLPGGERIVHLRNWDLQANDPEPRALHDFVVWRQAMRSVTDFGAWEDVARNLTGRDGEVRPVA